MIKADSVHSTPPLNSSSIHEANRRPEAKAESADSFSRQPAIGQPERGNLTSESKKPAERLSRRVVLAGVASAAVIPAAMPATAEQLVDPIFAAIEVFRRADAEYMGFEGPDDIPDELGNRQWDAQKAVWRTRPTTLGGLVALTSFARDRTEWLIANGSIRNTEDEREVFATIESAAKTLITPDA